MRKAWRSKGRWPLSSSKVKDFLFEQCHDAVPSESYRFERYKLTVRLVVEADKRLAHARFGLAGGSKNYRSGGTADEDAAPE